MEIQHILAAGEAVKLSISAAIQGNAYLQNPAKKAAFERCRERAKGDSR